MYKSWTEARKAVVGAHTDGLMPSIVHEDTWKVFETVAFLLVPQINRYVPMGKLCGSRDRQKMTHLTTVIVLK